MSVAMNADDVGALVATPERELMSRNYEMRYYVRKAFGLDRGNNKLLRATHRDDPADAALVIVTEFRRRSQNAINDPADY